MEAVPVRSTHLQTAPKGAALRNLCAVTTFTLLMGTLAFRLFAGPYTPAKFVVVVGAGLVGYVLADFVSGVVHWMGDTFFEYDTPLIGPGFVRPFREHHVDPEAILHHSFLTVNGNSSLVTLLILVPTWLFGAPENEGEPVPLLAVQALVFFLSLFILATNQFHKWSHQPSPGPLVRLLQRTGLILTPERHAVHHSPPHRFSYCITSGWLNPLLDRLGLFERAERLVRRRRPARRARPTVAGPTG